MKTTKEISQRRIRLKSEEEKLISELEDKTVELESSLKSSLKTLAIAGAGALTVIGIYYLLSGDNDKKKGEKKKSNRPTMTKSSPSPITTSIVSLAIQKLLPIVLEKISLVASKSKKNA